MCLVVLNIVQIAAVYMMLILSLLSFSDFFLSPLCVEYYLRGDWPVKFWSQNVPEEVFVFFQVWVPKHAYFSSKSVFL